jgi:hypothetical protein
MIALEVNKKQNGEERLLFTILLLVDLKSYHSYSSRNSAFVLLKLAAPLEVRAKALHTWQVAISRFIDFVEQFAGLLDAVGRHPVFDALKALATSGNTAVDVTQSQVGARLVEVQLPVEPEIGLILNLLAHLFVQGQGFLWRTHVEIAPAFQNKNPAQLLEDEIRAISIRFFQWFGQRNGGINSSLKT